jgi:hypothetical protein
MPEMRFDTGLFFGMDIGVADSTVIIIGSIGKKEAPIQVFKPAVVVGYLRDGTPVEYLVPKK